MYSTGPTAGEIVFIILMIVIGIIVSYVLIRLAVKHGTIDALHEYDQIKAKRDDPPAS
jgi:mannose/fructose/N-acetylgalactosamine-specific phosphotransferase system component IID